MPTKPKTFRPHPHVAPHRHSDQQRNQQPYRRLLWTQGFRRFRRAFLAEHPLCGRCEKTTGRLVPAKDVHHVRGLGDHPEDLCDAEQCEAMCHACHGAATARGE